MTRGIQVAIGFEFGVHPPELASIVPPESRIPGAMLPDPTHPANIEILQATLEDLLTAYPGLDWVWLWLHEHSMFVRRTETGRAVRRVLRREKGNFSDAPNEHDVFTGIWSLAQIRQVHEYLAQHSPHTRLAIGGWGGGPQLPPVLRGLDRALPTGDRVQLPESRHGRHGPRAGARGGRAASADVGDPVVRGRRLVVAPATARRLGQRSSQGGVRRQAVRRDRHPLAHRGDPPEPRSLRPDGPRPGARTARRGTLPAALRRTLRSCRRRGIGAIAAAASRRRTNSAVSVRRSSIPTVPRGAACRLHWPRTARCDRLDRPAQGADERRRSSAQNLDWLADNFRCSLLLDEVGRKIEPAYALKEQHLRGEVAGDELAAASRRLPAANWRRRRWRELFRTFARRVRSRGELGELSSLNQKLWLQYRELDQFLRQVTDSQTRVIAPPAACRAAERLRMGATGSPCGSWASN